MLDQTILKNPLLMKSANLIDGEWIAAGADAIPVTNPATSVLLGSVPNSGRKETKRAVEAAARAFPAWRAKTAAERAAILRRLHALILEHQDDLAQLLTLEQGKSLPRRRARSASPPPMCCGSPRRRGASTATSSPRPGPDRRILVTKEPVGVVAAITPWNFPSSMIARKLGPALAAGCTIGHQAGLADALFGPRLGRAVRGGRRSRRASSTSSPARRGEIGDELTSNPRCKKITFTGSTEVGKMLMEQAAKTMKKVSMELGGNAPFIVFDDADIDRAVEGAMVAKYRNSGQTCVCTNRFLVQDGIYDAFVEKLAAAAEQAQGRQRPRGRRAAGPADRREGGRQGRGAHRRRRSKGRQGRRRRQAPCARRHLLRADRHHRRDARDALHEARRSSGRCRRVFRFKDEAEAVRMANDTEFGLASLFLHPRPRPRLPGLGGARNTGMVGVNEGLITTEVAPFGGVKESGVGREGSKYGIEDYLSVKYTCVGGLDG